jgi:hypothetical protein
MRGGMEGPAQFPWSQAILAGATFDPLATWDYQTPDTDVAVEVIDRATAVGVLRQLKSGGQAITQEGPVQAGGTAGTIPARLSTEPQTGRGYSNKKLSVFYRNPTGGTITVDGMIIATPIGGGRRAGGGPPAARRAPVRRPRRRR